MSEQTAKVIHKGVRSRSVLTAGRRKPPRVTEIAAAERTWQLQIEKAEYEAGRAERQYVSVEPENRTVARELERRWEQRSNSTSRPGLNRQTSVPLRTDSTANTPRP